MVRKNRVQSLRSESVGRQERHISQVPGWKGRPLCPGGTSRGRGQHASGHVLQARAFAATLLRIVSVQNSLVRSEFYTPQPCARERERAKTD